MPYAARSRCTIGSCGEWATRRGRCPDHQPVGWQRRSQNTQTLSGWDRKRFHDAVFREHGNVCVLCGGVATDADHIVEVADGGAHDPVHNGQPLCGGCHTRKTKRAASLRRRRGKGS